MAQNNSRPTAAMLEEMSFVGQWLQSLGATVVKLAPELYIRHAGNVTNAVAPLSGTQMLSAGVPASEALATFATHSIIEVELKDWAIAPLSQT